MRLSDSKLYLTEMFGTNVKINSQVNLTEPSPGGWVRILSRAGLQVNDALCQILPNLPIYYKGKATRKHFTSWLIFNQTNNQQNM
ncbi:hypothetical protein XELAEV_18025528mg [Xenopus laevis]|uniref:Uncharacterized protein n=1 Tax=Xenopus laevis TaxID=8355 RepID=A0A974D257_XENLA|nr:hypothetical protein XELAEV_18025528mg [Xenopus laevis]